MFKVLLRDVKTSTRLLRTVMNQSRMAINMFNVRLRYVKTSTRLLHRKHNLKCLVQLLGLLDDVQGHRYHGVFK